MGSARRPRAGYVIQALAWLGIALDVHQPTPDEVLARQAQLERLAAKNAETGQPAPVVPRESTTNAAD